ncbi:MAG: Zn-dependent hydrolase [Anaerolineae bacterium]|nr:Zn-dependent hydrolase [Anaerolineae bacterium]
MVALLNPQRVIADLRELAALTSDENGAQRVAWTPTWAKARDWYRAKLAELPVEVEQDEAGNLWATLRGASSKALIMGSHLDSVPNGGWLDGCLGVLAGLEVLRRIAARGRPPVTVRLVDWADEEGARFGRSLFGSSAVAGRLNLEWVSRLADTDGVRLPDAVRTFGVNVETAEQARRQIANAGAYLEMHIEQGPVLESLSLPLGAVIGCYGIERHQLTFVGAAAHAGGFPMHLRRDAFLSAARFALAVREIARRCGGVGTNGRVRNVPDIPTAVAGECAITLDMRHMDAAQLQAMVNEARAASEAIAGEEGVSVAWRTIYQSPPQPFDAHLVDLCDAAIREVNGGVSHRMPSGPGHDAIEMAWAGVPTVMLFVQSLRGLSHNKEEDTRPEHLELAVRAFDRLADKAMAWLAA